jgi:hypothetical protein
MYKEELLESMSETAVKGIVRRLETEEWPLRLTEVIDSVAMLFQVSRFRAEQAVEKAALKVGLHQCPAPDTDIDEDNEE